jgi:ABC-type oligopeptide transport system substrate-binding subunit
VVLLCRFLFGSQYFLWLLRQNAQQVLYRGNGAEPETLDPQQSSGVSEANIETDLFEGLVTYGP